MGETAAELLAKHARTSIGNKTIILFIFSPLFISGFHFREKELHTK